MERKSSMNASVAKRSTAGCCMAARTAARRDSAASAQSGDGAVHWYWSLIA
jgi:hypothetical protein